MGDIVGYSVEIFSNNMSKGWIPVASKIGETVYTQRDLTRGATYIFVVRAENKFGISAPSSMSDPVTTGKPILYDEDLILTEAQAILSSGDVVELLEANATDSSSVRLVWEILNAQYVEGFYIYSRKLDRFDQYKMLTVLHGGGASSCMIEGLDAYADYEFFLVPFYKTVKGRPSNSKIARTHEDSEYFFVYMRMCCETKNKNPDWCHFNGKMCFVSGFILLLSTQRTTDWNGSINVEWNGNLFEMAAPTRR